MLQAGSPEPQPSSLVFKAAERRRGQFSTLYVPSLTCLCPPQATYVLLALAWVFVPIYLSSEVSLLRDSPAGGLGTAGPGVEWVVVMGRTPGFTHELVSETTSVSSGFVSSPTNILINPWRQVSWAFSPGALSVGLYCTCMLHLEEDAPST